jgi:hypothetical protein
MKKQITLSIAGLFAFALVNAQAINPANRTKAAIKISKQVKQSTTSKTDVPGQGEMTQRMDNTTTFSYDVSATNEQGGTAEIKITAVKTDVEMMGQEMSYDSQNPEDGSQEMGEQVKSMMKNPIKITLDANGVITTIKGNEKFEAANSNNAGGGLEKGELLDVFFKVSKTVNLNDTWEDKVDTKEEKISSKYTYKSFENGIATIEQISTMNLDQKMEQMGMTMYSKQEGTMVITYTVDVNTLLIKSKTSTIILKGTIDAGGRSMPMSSFVQSTETFQ